MTPDKTPTDAELASLRAEFGITSNGRGIKEFTQVADFARAVLAKWGSPVVAGEAIAEIGSAAGDDAGFGQRAIYPLVDIDRFEYGTKLYANNVLSATVEPWGACIGGRVWVGKQLPEIALKLAEAEGRPVQWLYTAPQPTQAVRWESDLAEQAMKDMEGLRVKAARYDWLRGCHWSDVPDTYVVTTRSGLKLGVMTYSEGRLDEVIDARMAKDAAIAAKGV